MSVAFLYQPVSNEQRIFHRSHNIRHSHIGLFGKHRQRTLPRYKWRPCFKNTWDFHKIVVLVQRKGYDATNIFGDDSGENMSRDPAALSNVPEKSSLNHAWRTKLSVAGILFLLVTYVWAIVLFVPMVIAHPFVLLFDGESRRFHDFIAMSWMRMSLWTVRVRLNVINAHNIPIEGQPVVYVANHLSYLDIFVFSFLHRRIKYVSKAEIFRIPIVGWAMRLAGNIALIRNTRRSQMQTYRQMLNVLKSGSSLVIFPEGTRSSDGRLRRFKDGAFRAAKQLKVPVVPITIIGTREVMPPSAWVPLSYPNHPISIVIHSSIDSLSRSIRQLADVAFDEIQSALPNGRLNGP